MAQPGVGNLGLVREFDSRARERAQAKSQRRRRPAPISLRAAGSLRALFTLAPGELGLGPDLLEGGREEVACAEFDDVLFQSYDVPPFTLYLGG